MSGRNDVIADVIRILLIGKSGRNDAVADTVARSRYPNQLFIFSDVMNSSLLSKAYHVRKGRSESCDDVASYAAEVKPDFAIIGPEEPLAVGVVDRLAEMGIPCVGPTQELAKLESSKSFTRRLLSKYKIQGNPEHRIFHSIDGMESYLRRQTSFVIKPDGLTSGKGVQVFGEHLKTIEQAMSYCQELFAAKQPAVIIEEKLDGEEFSFQSFCDGYHVVDTFPVQDHKRAGEADTGPNTGGMGSYSCEDHSLPFLRPEHIKEASQINQLVCDALR
ncbi:MAG: phosphoribosylamine--glycine ligase, partial [bacterium]|nr:phosphoribosylamine--glycine ligase [bacterium]